VRFLTLAEALAIAQQITEIDAITLANASRIDLLDSALHAPQANYGNTDFYPNFFDKAAVLCSRVSQNHALPDGNKRLSWMCLVIFCDMNGWQLHVEKNEAVQMMVELAEGAISEVQLARWINERCQRNDGYWT
jgi:death-on-curing protein